MAEWTEADVRAYYAKIGKPCPLGDAQPVKKESKYHNQKTERNGMVFDSKKEADRWDELQLLLKAGEILAVFWQVPFRVSKRVKYIADFVILNRDGTFTVEDAKGMKTPMYNVKKKMMKDELGIDVKEV
jgi:dsDNA-binding SOS-regulon protein